MLRFDGDRDFARPPEELFARMTDPRFLVQCLPDVESVRLVEADHAELVLRPGFAFVRGTLEVSLRIVEAQAPTAARIVIASKGIGTSAQVQVSLALAAVPPGTRVHWIAEVQSLGGLLKLVPSGLIRGAAEKVVADVWTSVEKQLSSSS